MTYIILDEDLKSIIHLRHNKMINLYLGVVCLGPIQSIDCITFITLSSALSIIHPIVLLNSVQFVSIQSIKMEIKKRGKQDPFKVFTEAEGYINEGASSVEDPGYQCNIILGNTRSGKSTVINYLLGTPLKAILLDPAGKGSKSKILKIIQQNQKQAVYGPKIGNTVQSQTTTPKKYKSTKGAFKDGIFDNPGFGDNRGVAIDISNAVLVSKLLSKAKNIRIVLVIDFIDVSGDNPGNLISLVKQTNYLFGDIQKLKDSICIIVTKVPKNYDKGDVLSDLENIVKQIQDPEFKKQLLNHVIKEQRITLFQMPAKQGPLDQTNAQKIAQDVMALKPILSLDKVQVGISPDTKNYIYQNNMIILDYTKKDLKQFLGYLEKIIDVNSIKNSEQGIAIQSKLASIEQRINISQRDTNVKDFIQRLYGVMKEVNVGVPEALLNSIKSKLYLIEFVKKIIELNTMEVDQFKNDTSSVLSKILQKLMTKIYQLQYQEGKIKQEQYEKQIQEQKRLHAQHKKEMEAMNHQMRQAQDKHAAQLAKVSADNQRYSEMITQANNSINHLNSQITELRKNSAKKRRPWWKFW